MYQKGQNTQKTCGMLWKQNMIMMFNLRFIGMKHVNISTMVVLSNFIVVLSQPKS